MFLLEDFFEDYIFFAWWNIWVSVILLLPSDTFYCQWQGHSVTHKGERHPLFCNLQVLIRATSVVMPSTVREDLGLHPQCTHSNSLTSRDLPYTILTTHWIQSSSMKHLSVHTPTRLPTHPNTSTTKKIRDNKRHSSVLWKITYILQKRDSIFFCQREFSKLIKAVWGMSGRY